MDDFESRSHTLDGEYDAQKSHMHNINISLGFPAS